MRSTKSVHSKEYYTALDEVRVITSSEEKRNKFAMRTMQIVTFMCICVTALCVKTYTSNAFKLLDVCSKYDELYDNYMTLYNDYDSMYKDYKESAEYILECESTIKGLSEMVETLDTQSKSLAESNQEYFDTIQQYERREELFDKYEYAIVRTNGSRTDITYDQLADVEELTADKGIDTDFVLSIFMVESQGTENAYNPASGASGYGQTLASTGKFVYEKLLKEGKYSHQYALDGDTNIRITVEYIDWLEEQNENIFNVIKSYSGSSSDTFVISYIQRLDKYLVPIGKRVETIM